MALSLKTEKQIKLAMKEATDAVVLLNKNGNHTIVFYKDVLEPLARFTLRQIIGKRYAKRKNKGAKK